MKRGISLLAPVLALSLFSGAAAAQQDLPKPVVKKQLGVGEITPTKALKATVVKSGHADKLDRLVDSLNQHLLVAFNSSRKFTVVARADLAEVLKEQQLPAGLIVDATERKSLPAKIKGLDYLCVAAVTDFSDAQDGVTIEGQGIVVSRRTVQTTVILKLYNTTTGALLEAIDVPVQRETKGTQRVVREGFNNGAINDSLIEEVAVELAAKSANRVTDLVYPARIVDLTDNIVTINRGESTGIAANQVWEVFATGKDLVDPDTGEVIGKQEVRIGQVEVFDVQPKFSKARVVGENRGIDATAILRRRLADPRDSRGPGPGPGPHDPR